MHPVSAPRLARFIACALLATSLTLPGTAWGDTIYTVSLTNGGLFRFDSADPYGTMTILSGTGTFESPSALALGPDGNLYIGDLGSGGRISRYTLKTGSISTVALVNSDTSAYSGPVWPASIAFRTTAQGGQMLVGRSPFGSSIGYPQGPVLQIAGWDGNSPVVTDYTTGTAQAYAPGLAVASSGTLYASNQSYDAFSGIATGSVLAFSGSGTYQGVVVPDTSPAGLYGPSGLVLSGSMLYTASVMNGNIYATNLITGSTSQFGPSVGTFEAGALTQLSTGELVTASPGFSGNIYKIWSSGSATLYDSTLATGTTYNLGEAFNLGQIGGILAVPEPATLALAGCGIAVVAAACRRRRRPVA